MVFFGFSLVWFGFVWFFSFYYAHVLFFGFIMAILGSHLVLDWFFNGLGQVRLQWFLSPAHSGEGGGSSPEMPQTLRSSKRLQNDCFWKLFVRVSGCESLGCSGALISVFSSYARTAEDIIKSRVERGARLEHWISIDFLCFSIGFSMVLAKSLIYTRMVPLTYISVSYTHLTLPTQRIV